MATIDHLRPITLGDRAGGFYAEFLTPLTGSGRKQAERGCNHDKAGISAQKIRHLDVLLVDPWIISLGQQRAFRCRNN